MELNIGICDDNPFYCKILCEKLKIIVELKEAEINLFYTSSDFLDSMKITNYDIVFMHMELDNHNSGLNLALELKAFQPSCLIVYVSSFNSYYYEKLDDLEKGIEEIYPYFYTSAKVTLWTIITVLINTKIISMSMIVKLELKVNIGKVIKRNSN